MKRVVAFLLFGACLSGAPLHPGWLWRDPGNIAAIDFGEAAAAPVHAPKAPFTFLKEDTSGTQPKVLVRDAEGATWDVKFGYEVHTESFCWRVIRACGYFAEPSFFVAAGKLEGFHPLQRPTPSVLPDGRFTDARFQFRAEELKYHGEANWRWDSPPFGGTRELNGLKILIMLFSNWDNKDGRVGKQGGPNTAMFELRKAAQPEFIYAFTDWGSGLGDLRGPVERSNWRCPEFTAESAKFVERVEPRQVVFHYEGNIKRGFQTGIPPAHVAWLMQYLGSITDRQLRAGLKASGASDPEADCFTKALRARIEQLRAIPRPTVTARRKLPPHRFAAP